MRIKIDLESDELIHGLLLGIDDHEVIVYEGYLAFENGETITDKVTLKVEYKCPSCDAWISLENWTEKYICQSCAWDSLETEAYGEIL